MTANAEDTDQWLEQHGDYLFRIAFVRTGSRETAEDLVQDTLLAALGSLDRYDGSRPVRFWLRGILRHKIVDHYRRRERAPTEIPVEDAAILDSLQFRHFGIPPGRTASWSFNPRRACEKVEFRRLLRECVARLDGKAQQAFVLRELEELGSEEVCEVLGVSANYLWVLVHRARQRLKRCLSAHWEGGDDRETEE